MPANTLWKRQREALPNTRIFKETNIRFGNAFLPPSFQKTISSAMIDTITNAHGEILDFSFHEGAEGSRNLFLIGHGVTGNKNRPLILALAHALSEEGMPVLRFSFSGNGASGGNFRDSTISKEIGDLKAVLSAAETFGYRVFYAGHSMGGAVGVMTAAIDSRIKFLVSLAGMVDTKGFYEREFGQEKTGSGCMWEDPSCPLSETFKEDMYQIGSTSSCAEAVRVPWLLVHGTADDVVPLEDSKMIFSLANEPKHLVEIPDADHLFSGNALGMVVETVLDWIGDCLQGPEPETDS